MDYGRAIRIVRTAYGLGQGELADRLSIGASHLSLIESGKRQPSLRALNDISTGLQVPIHLLTLLASDPVDVDDPSNAKEIADLAKTLLRVLVSGHRQPTLPISAKKMA